MFGAKVIQVIETDLEMRGDGVNTIMRRITQYWSLDGQLLWEADPFPNGKSTVEQVSKSGVNVY